MRARSRIVLVLAVIVVFAGGLGTRVVLRGGVSARDEPGPAEAFLARRLRHLAIPRRARTARNPVPLTDDVLAEAREHFLDHCSTCHGTDGRGDTPIGRNLYPRVPDMTTPAVQSLADGELFYVIHNGVRFTGMPAWGDGTPEDDLDSWRLVHFIRHLPHEPRAEHPEHHHH